MTLLVQPCRQVRYADEAVKERMDQLRVESPEMQIQGNR